MSPEQIFTSVMLMSTILLIVLIGIKPFTNQ
jgi:hypothetical protein